MPQSSNTGSDIQDAPPASAYTEDAPADAASGVRRADPLLLEVAWEACNQVGGIYTVLRSKAPTMVEQWGNRYCLVGPYEDASAQIEFEPAPMVGPLGQAVNAMREMGFGAHYGRWLVSGRPHLVLLNHQDAMPFLSEIKNRLRSRHHVPIPDGDGLMDQCLAFGELVRLFLTLVTQREGGRRDIIAHFHEWMGAVAVPFLREEQWPGTSVFTTHATLLGRYLAMHDPVFYDHLPFFNPLNEARHFNIEGQFELERSAAHGATVFTTVSDVTAEECKYLLGREADVLLPNGLNIQRFTALHEFQNLHAQYKEMIHDFTIGHFFPSYSFDLDKTLYFFTSGRYEYRNKGMDLTIETLARLNWRLKAENIDTTVVFFLITKAPYKTLNVHTLETRSLKREFRVIADAIKEQIGDRLFHEATAGRMPDLNAMVDEYWKLRLRRTMQAFGSSLPPAIVTHDLLDDANDAVLNQFRACQLFNREEDPVKVVFHPDFIRSTSPLFAMEYDQFVRGCHLGIFPSYYEPWGYTPLESIAMGVPAVTSDLSGFGSYLQHLPREEDYSGVYIAPRRQCDFHHSAAELTEYLVQFCKQSRRDRITTRNHVEAFSEHFDWNNLVQHYNDAHQLALERNGATT